MTYEQWINRPVYKAQIHTANTLKALMGLPSGNLVTKGNHPFLYFRLVSSHRCAYSLALRKKVADVVRETRKNGTYKLQEVTS